MCVSQCADGNSACSGSAGSGSGVSGRCADHVLDSALASDWSILQEAARGEQREQGDPSAGNQCLCVPDADGDTLSLSLSLSLSLALSL